MDAASGQRIDRYVVERQLGAGGFGAVYLARHSVLDTRVALKVLSPQHSATPGMVDRFLREAQMAAGIGSPHIVAVSDAGVTADGLPFLAMEVLEGEDLEQRMRRAGTLTIPEAIDVAIQILDGLGAAHAAGIVHRDMKPANVFLVRSPDGRPFVKLLDFGISKVVDPSKVSSLTKTGMMLGTPAYMAPEQLQDTRGVDHRADLYAATAILFEMVSGRLPYAADSFGDLMERVQGRAATSLDAYVPQAPPALVAVLARGLSREPGARYASATEMARALRDVRAQAYGGVPTTTAPPSMQTPPLGGFGEPPLPETRGVATPGPGGGFGSASASGSGVGSPSPGGWGSASPSAASTGAAHPPVGDVGSPPSHGGFGPPPSHASNGAWSVGQAPPSWGPTATPAPRRSIGLWIGVGAAALLVPLACVGGGFLAFGLSDDGASTPATATSGTGSSPAPPPVAPSPPPFPAPPPPSFPSAPAPPPFPGPAASAGPPTATPIPDGADACAVPVVHDVQCDRAWDEEIPEPCELRRGRELHLVGAYEPQDPDGVVTVDVARTAAPIVLMLSAYADTTWRLRVADGVEIAAVHLVGRGNSRVEGVPDGVQVRHGRGYPIMGWSWEGMSESWSGRRTAIRAEEDTDLAVRAYVGCYNPTRYYIGQRAP